MRIVEQAASCQKVLELRSGEAVLFPGDAGCGAGPGLVRECRPEPFGNSSVERGVVRSNYVSVFDESNDRLCVDNFALNHVVGDAGQLGDLRSDRMRGLPEGLEDID